MAATVKALVDAIVLQEGSLFVQKSVCRSIQSKYGLWNPGHLMYAGQRGAQKIFAGDRNWAAWPTLIDGLQGIVRQIALDAARGLTLAQFIAKYAPPNENNTSTYLESVCKRLEVDPSIMLKDIPYE